MSMPPFGHPAHPASHEHMRAMAQMGSSPRTWPTPAAIPVRGIPDATHCPCGPQSVGSCDRCGYGYCARHGNDGVCTACAAATACACGRPGAYPCDNCGTWFCRHDGQTPDAKTWDRDAAVFVYTGGLCDACVQACEHAEQEAVQSAARELAEEQQRRTAAIASISDPIERFLTVMAEFTPTGSPIQELPDNWVKTAAEHCSDIIISDNVNRYDSPGPPQVRLQPSAVGKWFAERAAAQGIPTVAIDVVRSGLLGQRSKIRQAWVLRSAAQGHLNRSDGTHACDVYVLTDGRLYKQWLSGMVRPRPRAESEYKTAAPPVVYTMMGQLLHLQA